MIDFADLGKIKVHKIRGQQCVQFFPKPGKTVNQMVSLLDTGLEHRPEQRGILIQRSERFPTPCVLLFEKGANK